MGNFSDVFYTPEGLYAFSRDFFNTALHAIHEFGKIGEKSQGKSYYLTPIGSVAATNISFSLELAFKGLYLFTKNARKQGHKLLKLFTGLPDAVKNDIQMHPLPDGLRNFPVVVFGDNPIFDDKIKFVDGSMEEIIENLRIHDFSFVELRYLFETEGAKPRYYNFAFMTCMVKNTLVTLNDYISHRDAEFLTSSQ